jgi:hypothetical protein
MQPVLVWSIVLIGLLLAAAVAVMFLRRWMSADAPGRSAEFTLAELRQMHRDGRLSDDEFGRMKDRLLRSLPSRDGRMPPGPP